MRHPSRAATAVLALLLSGVALAREPSAVLLGSNRDALQARGSIVFHARREINASSFIFASDRLGQMGLAMLRAQARAGKKVRLLVELTGRTPSRHDLLTGNLAPPIPRSLLVHLAEEGVEVRFYNPPRGKNLLKFWRLGRRMHDKILSVDDEELIVGGRNFSETYFGLRPRPRTPLGRGVGNPRPYRDLDVYARGQAAADAGRYFRELFDAAHVMPPWAKLVRRTEVDRAKASLDHYERMLARPKLQRFLQGQEWRRNTRKLTSIEFIHDPIRLDVTSPRTLDRWEKLFATANHEIVISSAYGLPSKRMLALLERTIASGIRVKLLTNSRRSNEPLLQAAYELAAPKLAAIGVEIYEYQGREMHHVKAILIDGERGYIGSANIDGGSEKKNTETGITFDGRELGEDLGVFLARIERDSKRVTGDRKLLPDAWAPHETLGRKLLWPVLKNGSRFPPLYNRL